MTGTDNCRKNSFKTPATTCTVYSSKLTWSIPESARDNAGKKKKTQLTDAGGSKAGIKFV